MNTLEVRNLYKKLNNRQIIKDISFTVSEGEIFGFLGPNGAGKTTTIKLIVGFLAPDSGSIIICGDDIKSNRIHALRNISAIVEIPELYPYLTGFQNLKQIARMDKKVTLDDINRAVSLVGLENRINDKVGRYSLGMKQRLGLAQSLMSNPKLLILDEPINGLDPSGIIEFRNILATLAKEKNTSVFISSHILSEIELLCHKVAYIHNGQIKSIENLNENINDSNYEQVIIKTMNVVECKNVLESLPYVEKITLSDSQLSLITESHSTSKIIRELTMRSLDIDEIYKKKKSVEDRYLEIVNGDEKQWVD